MFKTIRESFKITNGNIIIATPLIFFSLISSLYLIFSATGNKIGLIFSVVLFFLMFGAFLSGWFYIIIRAIKEPEIESNNLMIEFPSGVGEYFLSAMGMIIHVIIVFALISIGIVLVGKKIIGGVGISFDQIVQAVTNVDATKAFLDSLNNEQLARVNLWNLIALCSLSLGYFIFMLYPTVIFFKEKNPFLAFFICLKDTFGHRFFKNAGLFIFISLLYMIISLGTVILGKNIVLHFVFTLLSFYYITFTGILLCNYYYSNFIKIGSNIDTTV